MLGRLTMTAVPPAAARLGAAGAIPFVAGALAVWSLATPLDLLALEVLRIYAACILSFLGAVHWGLAMAAAGPDGSPDGRRLALSVLPCLIGWAALLIVPWAGLILLILAFAGLFFYDVRATAAGLAAGWYPDLRRPLTLAVILSLGLALMGAAWR